ncbi:MAG: MarR family transcriptional regulator [Actinobacteria bacterium]|nr:MAG: MarR family transcriptional regulator [Actinomycetota bacterium]
MSQVRDQELAVTAREVRQAVVRLARRLRTQRQEHGIGNLGVSVLSQLHRHTALTPRALADAERVTPQTLTRVLASLAERGLIVRRGDPSDGRQSLLELTDAARRVLRADAAKREEWLAAAMARELTPAEQEIVRVAAGLLDRLADA